MGYMFITRSSESRANKDKHNCQSQIKIHIKKIIIIINEKLNDNSFPKSKLPEVC